MIKLIASTMEDNVSTRMGEKRNTLSCIYLFRTSKTGSLSDKRQAFLSIQEARLVLVSNRSC